MDRTVGGRKRPARGSSGPHMPPELFPGGSGGGAPRGSQGGAGGRYGIGPRLEDMQGYFFSRDIPPTYPPNLPDRHPNHPNHPVIIHLAVQAYSKTENGAGCVRLRVGKILAMNGFEIVMGLIICANVVNLVVETDAEAAVGCAAGRRRGRQRARPASTRPSKGADFLVTFW